MRPGDAREPGARVGLLRQALGDSADNPRLLAVRGHGNRVLILAVPLSSHGTRCARSAILTEGPPAHIFICGRGTYPEIIAIGPAVTEC